MLIKCQGVPTGAGIKDVTPTVGFSTEQVTRSNIKFTVFDMSGQSRYRNLWEVYYVDVQVSVLYLRMGAWLCRELTIRSPEFLLQNRL